jgi:BirA family biotin operon repressor/biotin-[acetyl-CoA-carboxylase] ligase
MLIHNAVQGETLSATVASIGLNVNQEVFKSNAPNPVSLKQITGVQYDLQLLLNTLMQRLMQRYEQLKTGKWDSLDSDYLRCLFRFRELAQYIYKNKRISARITGIDEFGRLMLEDTKQQAYLCEMKEIRFCL